MDENRDKEKKTERQPNMVRGCEPLYTVKELIRAAETAIKQPQDCVTAALIMSGKEVMTLDEAKRTVKKFMERKVR